MRRKGRETQFTRWRSIPPETISSTAFLALILANARWTICYRLRILLPVWIVFLFIAFTVRAVRLIILLPDPMPADHNPLMAQCPLTARQHSAAGRRLI